MKNILIVDDEESIRQSLVGILDDEGFKTTIAADGAECLKAVTTDDPDLILLDIWMPKLDGLETLKRIKQDRPDQLVIMMSGHGTIETAIKATRLGAFDFIEKPLSLEKVLLSIENALKIGDLVAENTALKQKIGRDYQMIGQSQAIEKLKQQIRVAAPSSGWALITGENGTGKELVARAIHLQSTRADKPFVEVNCAAIPEELIESELFGHEKGAFTGATNARKGKFDQANGGTLFLDEIGDMSLKTQAKILRILQEHTFERVGGNKTIEVDVRVIAATNKDLPDEIRNGNFREDLYFRLNVLPFIVPPLRERMEDIPRLCAHFLKFFCGKESRENKTIAADALDCMTRYNWPGNVRELKNLIERLVIMTPGQTIKRTDLPQDICDLATRKDAREVIDLASGLPDSYKEAKELFEKQFFIEKLKKNQWNVSRTAEEIGLERSNLHRKIRYYGITPN